MVFKSIEIIPTFFFSYEKYFKLASGMNSAFSNIYFVHYQPIENDGINSWNDKYDKYAAAIIPKNYPPINLSL